MADIDGKLKLYSGTVILSQKKSYGYFDAVQER